MDWYNLVGNLVIMIVVIKLWYDNNKLEKIISDLLCENHKLKHGETK